MQEMLKLETWKEIEGYEGLYEVSNHGRVRSFVGRWGRYKEPKILQQHQNHWGYLRVCLSKNNKQKHYFVHRLVAQTFIPNPDKKRVVDHINTDTTDNSVWNLRWATDKENCNNSLTRKHYSEKSIGEKNNFYGKHHNEDTLNKLRKPVLQFTLDNEFIREWGSAKEVCDTLGVSWRGVGRCCRGERKTCHGYIWRFAESEIV